MITIRHAAALSVAVIFSAPAAHAGVVNPNNPGGDAFTNPTGANQGQAVGATGWYYNNVRKGGTVGIDGSHPRTGNGSVAFSSPDDGKADIEYLAGAVNVGGNYYATQSLGAFSSLVSMSYDWYREGTSANNVGQHPSMRVLIDLDGNLMTNDRGGLVFEGIYNGRLAAPVDQWVSELIDGNTKVWGFGLGADPNGGYAYDSSLADWQAFLPRTATIVGFSSGVGSGWGPFSGAVDNLSWNIGGVSTSTNFELAANDVPEPATFGLLAIGAAGLAARRRRAR